MLIIGIAIGLVVGFIAGGAFIYWMAKLAANVTAAIEASSKSTPGFPW